jgi:type VI secretion system protein ImpE
MQAEDLLKAGNIPEALAELQGRVRKAPADARLRIFLFQLLCVTGDWPRALNQLKVAGELLPAASPMVATYREAIACELLRERVFAGQTAPLVFGEPARWIALMIEALKPLAAGEAGRAADLRAEAFEAAPATPGSADGTPFAWIADADMRLGPLLELIINGKYYWAPFAAMRSLRFEAPSDLRDYVWTAVEIRWANGGEVMGFVPTRYVGTAARPEVPLKLARLTEWTDLGSGTFAGLGQRVLATDAGDFSLLDLRRVDLGPAAAAAEAAHG